MKKVLLITRPIAPPWDEGSKNSAYFIAKNVSEVEIHLMTKNTLPEMAANVIQHNIYTTAEIKDFNFEQKMRSLFFQWRVRGKLDINHYFFTPTALNSFLIKNFLTAKNTQTIQTIATLREDLWSDQDLKKLLFADKIITYSDYAKNKLASLGFKDVTRIYPGIDLEKYQHLPKDEETMRHFQISEADFVVTYPGEFTRLGATDDLVNMLPELFKKIPNCKFIFNCRIKNEKDAQKKNEIIATIKEFGILEKVVFTDTFLDMPKLYNIADTIVFPVKDMKGKFDVPLAVIEAMACEKPVIISDLPILKEFSNDQNSVLIETGNSEQLLSKIVELSKDVFKRDQIGQAARKYTEENFDIKNVAKQYEEVYQNLN